MFLKRLKISGFKSFAERTEFLFDQGLTALVGPNGCGKSNLVDAVKWLLGEQSPKSLRAREMADLIYNGGPSDRALGFAEATLVLSRDGREGQSKDEEILITRRVYRSSEGEYLLNNQPCRLKDIRELLMDTGLGASAYSVIEQGKVDFLLSAGRQERRIILDEAAGINKFKRRRKEALAKLERVETNLLRLGDVIAEVKRQLRSIKYQAGRARTFRRLRGLLRTMQLTWALHIYHSLYKEKEAQDRELSALREKESRLEARAKAIVDKRDSLEAQLTSLRREASHLAQEEVNLKAQGSSSLEQIEFNEKRIEELGQEIQRFENSEAHMRKRLEELEVQISGETKTLATLEEEKKKNGRRLQEARRKSQEITRRLEELNAHLVARKNQVVEIASTLAKLQNKQAVLASQKESHKRQLQRLEAKAAEVRSQLEAILSRKSALESREAELLIQDETSGKALAEMRRKSSEIERALAEQKEKCAKNLRLTDSLSSRRELLLNLISRREGVGPGAAAVLEASSQGRLQGIKGLLADFVSVPAAYAPAVEAALGDMQEYVITETREAALTALKFIGEKKNYRVAFIPLDAFSLKEEGPKFIPGLFPNDDLLGQGGERNSLASSFPLPLITVVKVDGVARPAVEYLLSGCFLVENLAQAEALRANGYADRLLVTLEGEVLRPPGIVVGGKQGAGGLIMRGSHLADLEERLSILDQERRSLEEEKEKKSLELQRVRKEVLDLEAKRQEVTGKLTDCRNELSQVSLSEETLSDEMEVSRLEIKETEAELKRIGSETGVLEVELNEKSGEKFRMEEEVASAEKEIKEKEEEALLSRSLGATLEVSIAEGEKRLEAAQALLGQLKRNLAERSQELSARQEEKSACLNKIAQTRSQVEAKKSLLAQVREKHSLAHCKLADLQQKEKVYISSLEETSGAQDKMNTLISEVSQQISRLELAQKETSVKMTNWEERIEEEYSEQLTDLHTRFLACSARSPACPAPYGARIGARETTNGRPPGSEEAMPVDFAALASPETDWLAYREEIDKVRKKISSLGNVNLEALSQEEELKTRAAFLSSQEADLKKAQAEILEVISRINRKSREMFITTFSMVRENFQEIFRKLFGGGRADIFLVDESDVLESDVEIIARPPGKEIQSITLLSGGESVLAAMALFFAILKAKPSPFCILDEVDAALDEANTLRFLLVLQDFLKGTQFIIITHNKRTMSAADALYGITMQKSGVSKRIAVKFQGRTA